MKNIITCFFIFLYSIFSFSQAPQSFSYQAVVRDAAGTILPNQNVNLKILILDNNPNGTVIYSETHNVITNEFGLINLQVGTGSTLTGTFSAIDWSTNNKYVRTEIDPNGGSSFSVLGTTQLLSVPYALYAESSGNSGANYNAGNGISISGNIISNTAPDQIVNLTGSGSTVVTGTYPNYTISSTDNVDDADNDPTNEIQTASQNGTDITLSNGGGTFSVSDGDTSLWKVNTYNNVFRPTGFVGIGGNNPQFRLHVSDTLSDIRTTSVRFVANGGDNSSNIYGGVNSQIYGTAGINRAVQASSGGISSGDNVSFAGFSDNALNNYGIISVSGNYSSTTGQNIGIYSLTNGSSIGNTGIFSEIGENTNGASNNGIVSYIHGNNTSTNVGMHSSVNNSLMNNIAIRADVGIASTLNSPNSATPNSSISSAVVATNQGTGGTTTYGVNAYSTGGSSTNFGVYGFATGNSPVNSYSIYGQEGTPNLVNYAGYFNGKVTITGTLSNPSDRRLKTNVTKINNGIIDKLISLNVYNYTYSPSGEFSSIALPTGEHTGLIAQELEEIFPQLVNEQYAPIPDTVFIKESLISAGGNSISIEGNENDKEGKVDREAYYVKHDKVVSYKAVNYIELIPLLLQGIKEQQGIINSQSEQIKDLNQELNSLKQQMNELINRIESIEK